MAFQALVAFVCTLALSGCLSLVVQSKAAVSATPTSSPPIAKSQNLTATFNTALPLTLAGSAASGKAIVKYTVLSGPVNGSLSGTAPNLTYTANAEFFGTDSFTFKVNDGTSDSASATVYITVVQPPTAYLSVSGNNGTAIMNSSSNPYLTASAAYAAANAYQQANGGVVVLYVGAGTFGGVTLSADWNSSVHVIGVSAASSKLGGITATGANDAGTGTEAQPGYNVEVSGTSVNLGDINTSGGTNYLVSGGATCITYNYLGGNITIHSGLTAGNLTASGSVGTTGGSPSLPIAGAGTVLIDAGASVGSITATGDPEELAGVWSPCIVGGGYGGTVIVNGVSGNIDASGGTADIDSYGNAGTVVVNGTSGAITDNAGGCDTSLSDGPCGSSPDAALGSVTVAGTSGDITANGPNNVGNNVGLNAQYNGQTVTVSGHAGNISSNGGSVFPGATQANSYAGSGGTITISGTVGTITADGGYGGDDDGVDGAGNGGSGGSITLAATANTGTITANGGNGGNNEGAGAGTGGSAGTVTANTSSIHGTITTNPGATGT